MFFTLFNVHLQSLVPQFLCIFTDNFAQNLCTSNSGKTKQKIYIYTAVLLDELEGDAKNFIFDILAWQVPDQKQQLEVCFNISP